MKKIFFMLLFLVSFSCFGQVFGEWESGEIVDDWGDSTGVKYIITINNNTFFRIMKNLDNELIITIRTHDYLDNTSEARTSFLRVDSNTPYELTGYTWGADGTSMIDIPYFSNEVLSEMKTGTKLRTINFDYEDVKILNHFSLTGFTKAYNWLVK